MSFWLVLWSEYLCHSQSSYIELLSPKVIVLGDTDFGRYTHHKTGALINGISALIYKRLKELPSPFHHRRNVTYLPDFERQSF